MEENKKKIITKIKLPKKIIKVTQFQNVIKLINKIITTKSNK